MSKPRRPQTRVVSTRLLVPEALRLRQIAQRNGLTQAQLVAEMLRSLLDAVPAQGQATGDQE